MLAAALTRNLSGGLSLANLTLANFGALFQARGGLGRAVHQPVAGGRRRAAGRRGRPAGGLVRGRPPRARRPAIDGLALLPAALPGVVVGVGLILAWNQPFWPATPYGTWGILLLSYTCLLLPYPVRYVGAALAQIG